jgi:GAF domain-containing protein
MIKEKKYKSILSIVTSLFEGETDLIANLSNTSAVLKDHLDVLWVGFYLVKDGELVLGPFQGPLACTRIQYGKGVCGTAWEQKKSLIVGDVHSFAGHIACSSLSNSEIVVPIFKNEEVVAVIDIDSKNLSDFDDEDKVGLERISNILSSVF